MTRHARVVGAACQSTLMLRYKCAITVRFFLRTRTILSPE
jgi:hypothetical protein